MRRAAKLICTPLPRQEVQAGTPRLLAPLVLFAIQETLAVMVWIRPGSRQAQFFGRRCVVVQGVLAHTVMYVPIPMRRDSAWRPS